MINDVQKMALEEKFNEPYGPNELIIDFYKQIAGCLKLFEDADGIEFTEIQVLQQALYTLQTMGL